MDFVSYKVNPQHRGALPISQKSQWRVTEAEETALFDKAKVNEWICPKKCLWSIDDNFCVIGEDFVGELYVAKFWGNQGEWHGFPVSTKRQLDRPPTLAINDWVKKKIIRKRIGNKMAQGQF
ncbi:MULTISPECIES: hypothetical protein [Vibrio]|uniref:Uncharacterized protein n=1 Tax=Vibrio alginolyticus TaxID=663 RepID=A0A7Y0QXJ6_VIBAL|nr:MULTISPECIES: hypothetical protein [Vibrio]EGR1750669.1 hypothetical protein [Vibrio parahaemolyticus]EHG1304797.1 hypothetical protein [Vibrio parahaemolyticus]EJO9912344.1 hypothetical protein [Vibrio parahaemolyticus]MDF4739636.1 hypothetical protein [Vibrio parahaemolyticus]MDW2202031.1 hypothetical protein [Vibrio sp. 1636]